MLKSQWSNIVKQISNLIIGIWQKMDCNLTQKKSFDDPNSWC